MFSLDVHYTGWCRNWFFASSSKTNGKDGREKFGGMFWQGSGFTYDRRIAGTVIPPCPKMWYLTSLSTIYRGLFSVCLYARFNSKTARRTRKIVMAEVVQNLILGRKWCSRKITSRKNVDFIHNSKIVRRSTKSVMAKVVQNLIFSHSRDSADVKMSTQNDVAVSGKFICVSYSLVTTKLVSNSTLLLPDPFAVSRSCSYHWPIVLVCRRPFSYIFRKNSWLGWGNEIIPICIRLSDC